MKRHHTDVASTNNTKTITERTVYLRNLIKRDVQDYTKKSYLGALKYLPHAIYKLIETMPHPWETSKMVDVLFHTSGAITFVLSNNKVESGEYLSKWGQMWIQMQEEKRARLNFRRMQCPPFDDEEKIMDYDDIERYYPDWPEPIPLSELKLSDSFPFFANDHHFSNFQLARMKSPLLFDNLAFEIAKDLNIQLPFGPKFESTENEIETKAITAFENPKQIVVGMCGHIKDEWKVMYPHLYAGDFVFDSLPILGAQSNTIVTRVDGKCGFFVDSSIVPINDIDLGSASDGTEFCSFELSDDELGVALAIHNSAYPVCKQKSYRRPQDVPLIKQLYTQRRPLPIMKPKTRRSYQRLLKRVVKNNLKSKKAKRAADAKNKEKLLKLLMDTPYFDTTKIDWLEAGLQLCIQGHRILKLLIHKRGLHFMHLDYNFNLKPTKTLTTKERKRSRFGNSFHLIRELLKLVKMLVDCRLQFRMGNVNAYELNDAIKYIFTHMGQLTGIYRYKYKVMHQITACNDIKHVIYDRFNLNGVGKGPGCGIWQPMWCVWLGFLRGNLPLLERWLGNLVQRQFYGRVSKGISKTVSKQRIESHYDLELRASVLHDILDTMPESLRKSKTKVVMEHLSEAWRCWKANIPWNVEGMPEPISNIINRYIEVRSIHWTRMAHLNRERIRAGKVVDKAVARKNLGRLTRLWMRAEQERQDKYASDGPFVKPEDAVVMYKTMANFLREINFTSKIPFPSIDHNGSDKNLLLLALEELRDGYNMMGRLSNTHREELALIEHAYNAPYEALTGIKQSLMKQRVFKNVEVSLLDLYSHVSPVYEVDMSEKIVDSFLDHYLWNEAEKRGLFPVWLKPSDNEVVPIMVRDFSSRLNGLSDLWDNENGASSALIHLKLNKFVENCDLTLLNQLLKLIVDSNIADYITAKMNASLSFKDMLHVNQIGIINGFQFSSFVVQYYLLLTDLLVLGLPRALDMASSVFNNNLNDHPIRFYTRYLDEIYVVFHLSGRESEDMRRDFSSSPNYTKILPVYPVKTCWPVEQMMKMTRKDLALGRSLYEEILLRLPDVLGTIDCLDASIFSKDNAALMFEMAGFEVRIVPKTLLLDDESNGNIEEAAWALTDEKTSEKTAFAFVKVSQESINRFENRIKQILMTSGSTTFSKIVKRWNTALTAFATYFREAAVLTPSLLDVIVKCEIRVQNKVMMGLNSKMPARFPPCVFYSPEELGGLGMLSASHVMIPSSDIYGSLQQFKFGIGKSGQASIPNLFRYISSWESEAIDSNRVWAEYKNKSIEAKNLNTRVSMEDIEMIWERGLPRISTLFQSERSILSFDKGFRVRQIFKNYSNQKYNPFWWVNNRHDGRLWNFTLYRNDVIQALGGIRSILDHTLFKATGFEDWEGLFWQKQSGFEQQMQMQKLTNAQRSGLSQIPNRRFTLWWSPTINRGNVYIGFLVQLDLTGIFLHGKIPTLKISYIQVFRAHLWQKIHESLVMDLCQIIDNEQSVLQIECVEKLLVHPRKSYRMNASAADILLKSTGIDGNGWPISKPSILGNDSDEFTFTSSSDFWIDVQLRYGDFDTNDISKYTRAKYLDFTTDGVSMYPSKTGIIICFDLAYNKYDAYGNWFPGLKKLIRSALEKMKQANPSLYILRERIRKALQLHQTQSQQPHLCASNYLDIMNGKNLIVDDTSVYRVTLHKTKNGNMASKPINGALFTLDPSTGKLFMQVIHAATAWAGQKKLGAVSKWKAAEEEASLLRTLPKESLPEQIIISTPGLRDPMEVNLLEFNGISVRNSDLKLPFSALLAIPHFSNIVYQASRPEIHEFSLYDDWLDVSQPSTAFSRLMLILRGFSVNAEEAMLILTRRRCSKQNFIWPVLSREEWIELENEMSDIVVQEYCKSNGVDKKLLTQSEIRGIILGQPNTDHPENENVGNQKTRDEGIGISRETKTHNVHGDEITVVTTSNYEQQQFDSKNTWRNRALEASSTLQFISNEISIDPIATDTSIEIPEALIKDFISISDPRAIVIGFLYGSVHGASINIESIAVIPQLGSPTTIVFSEAPSILPDSEGLELLGYIRTQPIPRSDKTPPPLDFTLSSSKAFNGLKSPVTLILNLNDGDVTLQSFFPTKNGREWGKTNKDFLSTNPDGYDANFAVGVECKLGSKEGFFYTPDDDLWNYSFMSSVFNALVDPFMKIGIPIQYYDCRHRSVHFAKIN